MNKVERLNLEETECLKTIISKYKLPYELFLGHDNKEYRCLCSDAMSGTNLNAEDEGKIYSIAEGVREIILPAIKKEPYIMRGLPLGYFTIIMNLGYGFTSDNWKACIDMFKLFVTIGYGQEII